MKKITNFLSLILGIYIFAACSKDSANETLTTDNKSILVVTVDGIKEVKSSANTVQKNKSKLVETVQAPQIIQHSAFDVHVDLNHEISNHRAVQQKEIPNKVALRGLRADASAEATTYRIYLFKKDDGTFVSSSALSFGTAGQLQVTRGTTYTWHALSFNNTEQIPNISGTNGIIALPENRDILYTSGEFTVPSTENTPVALPITFSHKFAQLAIEVNTMGLFADMTALTAGVKIGAGAAGTIANSALDIKTGTLVEAGVNQNLSTLSKRNFSDIQTGYQDRKIAYFYVPVVSGNQNLKAEVQINGLSIRLDNGTIRNFDQNLSATPFTFQQDIALIEEGKSYYCTFNILESPITTNGVRWARENLYVHNNVHNSYRFFHTPQSTATNSTWKPQELIDGLDPCLNVYPEGTWKMPTQEEVKTAIAPSGFIDNLLFFEDPQTGLKYYEFAASGTASPYPSNSLRLNIIPFRPLPENNSRYWTLPLPNIGNGGDLDTYIIMLYGPQPFPRSIFITKFVQGGGIVAHNYNYPEGFPIRCIRSS